MSENVSQLVSSLDQLHKLIEAEIRLPAGWTLMLTEGRKPGTSRESPADLWIIFIENPLYGVCIETDKPKSWAKIKASMLEGRDGLLEISNGGLL